MGSRPVWRVRDRATFDALRQAGRRARRGPVTVTYLPPAGPAARIGAGARPSVAFAIGRGVGPAVVRNRLRRRLRAAFDDLARADGGVPGGTYLVSARPDAVALAPPALRAGLAGAIGEVDR